MYNKVVMPLDGSKLAEVALPHVEELAQKLGISEIMLVSVTARLKGDIPKAYTAEDASARNYHPAPAVVQPLPLGSTHMGQTGMIFTANLSHLTPMPASMGRMAKTALNYLIKIGRQLEKKGLNSSISVLIGDPAEEIVRFAEEKKADLIVIASRGKSGFNRWDMGNIAEKVLRATKITVVLVKPQTDFKETKPKRRGTAT